MIVFGLSTTFLLSLVALFFSGVTDGVSMVIRNTILRVALAGADPRPGRVGQLGVHRRVERARRFESGVAASVFGTVPAVVGGGFITLGVVGAVTVMVPTLRRLDIGTAKPTEDPPPLAASA